MGDFLSGLFTFRLYCDSILQTNIQQLFKASICLWPRLRQSVHEVQNNGIFTPMNNVGDPFAEKHYYTMNTLQFEKEVIEYFAPKYGFRDGEFWGMVSHSGTDGELLPEKI